MHNENVPKDSKAPATLGDLHPLKADLKILKADVHELKTDVRELKTDVHGLKTDVIGLKASTKRIIKTVVTYQAETRRNFDRVFKMMTDFRSDILKLAEGFATRTVKVETDQTFFIYRLDSLETRVKTLETRSR